MLIKIILIIILWSVCWGGCMGELYYLERESYDFDDILIVFALVVSPMFIIGMGVFILIYKTVNNKKG